MNESGADWSANRAVQAGETPESVRNQARAATVWRNFTGVSATLTVFYGIFTIVHYLHLNPGMRYPMMVAAAAATIINAGVFAYLYRNRVQQNVAHPIAALVVATILLNSALHLYLSQEPRETTNFVLIVIGCGIFFASTQWLLATLAVVIATWLGIAYLNQTGGEWVHFGFFVIEVTIMAVLAHELRMRNLNRLLASRLANENQRLELAAAVQENTQHQLRLQRLSEATFEAVFLHRDGAIVDVNEQAVRLFGYSRQELIQMKMVDLIAPEARQHSPFGRKTLHSTTGLRRDGHIHESVALHASGRRFPIEFGAVARRPEEGGVDAAAVRDITDRRRLEHRLRDFVESAIDFIFETDARGRFTYVNGATHRLLSRGDSLIGQRAIDFVHPAHRRRVAIRIARQDFMREPILYQEYRVFADPHDKERWLGQNVQPILFEGEVTGYRVVARNITDRVMAVRQALAARRDAEEANRGKSRFLSSMSHELRTPLNGILGFAQLLQAEFQGPMSDRQRKYVESVTECSGHLLNLIDDLLDLSKADINAMDLRPVPIQLDAMVESTCNIVRRGIDDKAVELVEAVPAGLRVKADSRRLRQILLNLLTNAVKYSPEDGTIRIEARSIEGNSIEISVQDEGPGVPDEHREKVFSEFFQSDGVRDGNLGGSGIGLALVKKLVALHGGEVGYRPRSEGGSEFWFTLFATTEPVVYTPPGARMRGTSPANTGQGRILVVDDVEANVFLITEALVGRGYAVETARNGAEAIERASDFEPDLILMDMRMPVMDGFEATRVLKSMERFRKIPIIALSASVTPEAKKDCTDAGCVEHLGKPIDLEGLFRCIARNLVPKESSETAIPPPKAAATSLRILVAEDDATNRKLLAALFARLPDEAVFVINGKEALDMALAQPFDVVLMDVQMPLMDGLEATRRIRDRKNADQLPVLGLSGFSGHEDREACIEAGMNDLLVKPIRLPGLTEMLAEYRDRKAADSHNVTDNRPSTA